MLFVSVGILFIPTMNPAYWIYRVVCFSVLIYLFISQKGYLTYGLNRSVFSKLARFSLAIYLTHWFVTSCKYGTIWVFKTYYPDCLVNDKELVIFLTLLSAIVLGCLSYYLIEKPSAKLLKNIFGWIDNENACKCSKKSNLVGC